MRRKEKQMSDEMAVIEVIGRALVCRLGMSDGRQPYVVPMSFGYADGALYLHCATQGRKLDILRQNSRVCFEFEADVEVMEGALACNWTMRYKSIIGFGDAVIVEGVDEKRAALGIIMNHYSKGDFEFDEKALQRTAVIKVAVESMTGKQSGY